MATCPYIRFQFFNNEGVALNIPEDLVIEASWSRTVNNVGTATLILPSDCTDIDFETISQEDLGLIIWVAKEQGQAAVNDLETFWFLRRFKETIVDKKASFVLTFKDANHLLDRRIVAYRADDPEGSSPQARISEPGNVALRRIFVENFINVDDPARDSTPYMGRFGIAAPSLTIDKEIHWKNILRTMQQICRTSRDDGQPLFFDLIASPTATDVRFKFRTYTEQRGIDKTPEAVYTSNPLFQLRRFEMDYDTANAGYAGGIGRGQDRQVGLAVNARSTLGRFTRYEEFKSVRDTTQASVDDEASNLVNNVAGIIRLEGEMFGELADQFNFGDKLLVNHRDFEVLCEIATISNHYVAQEYRRVIVAKSS